LRDNITALRQDSIEVIKKAHEAVAKIEALDFVTNITDSQANRGSRIGTPQTKFDNFQELERKLDIVGQQIVEIKHSGDKIYLLAQEINATSAQLAENELERSAQQLEKASLDEKIKQFKIDLFLQSEILSDLSKSVFEFKNESEKTSMMSPRVLMQTISSNRLRSEAYLNDSIKFYDPKVEAHLNESINNLEKLNDHLYSEKVSLDSVLQEHRSRALAEFELSTTKLGKVCHLNETLVRMCDEDEAEISQYSAKIILESASQDFDLYQSQYDSRASELDKARQSIELTKEILNATNYELDRFALRVAEMTKTISSSSSSAFPEELPIVDFSLTIVDNTTERIKASIDRLETRMATIRTDLDDISAMESRLNLETESRNFLSEMKKIQTKYENHRPNTEFSRQDQEKLADCNERTKSLLMKMQRINQDIALYAHHNLTSEKLRRDTKQLIELLIEQLGPTNSTGNSSENDRSFWDNLNKEAEQLSASTRNLNNVIRSKLEYVRRIQPVIFRHRLGLQQKVKMETSSLRNNQLESEKLIERLREGTKSVSHYLGIFSGQGENATEAKAKKLKDRLKLDSLRNEMKKLWIDLEKKLIRSRSLKDDFDSSQRKFTEQKEILEFLHKELVSTTEDLRGRLKLYESC